MGIGLVSLPPGKAGLQKRAHRWLTGVLGSSCLGCVAKAAYSHYHLLLLLPLVVAPRRRV